MKIALDIIVRFWHNLNMKNTTTTEEMNIQKAFAEGESKGMIDRSYWDGDFMNRPTDADLEQVADSVFGRFGLKFDSRFDGRMSFISGYWQGWRKAGQPRPERQLRQEKAHAESMAFGG